jgi:micrococcal nuclease
MLRRLAPFLVLLLLAGGYGYTRVAGDDGDAPGITGRVVRAVDGDTLVVDVGGGRQERVRYIGVDTPETVKPGAPVQCFGKYASQFNHRLVDGRAVRLVTDAEARDRYGRLLAYVYRAEDGMFVNAEMVRDGYAKPLTIPPNVRHVEQFQGLATEARRARRGLCNACSR